MADALILGGGLAGASAAIVLAAAGRGVTLLERTRGPHNKVCGEFLSAEALLYLRRLGIDPVALGALPIHTVRLIRRDRLVEQALPFPAMSLTRRVLDEALLARAAEAGATVLRGSSVDGLESRDGAWIAKTSAGEHAAADVFLATGKHDLRGHPRGPGKQANLVGLKMYFRLQPAQAAALHGAVEVSLFRGGYAGMQLVEQGTANLCLLVQRQVFQADGSRWPALLARLSAELPTLAQRLQDAIPLLNKPLALAAIPYGYRRTRTKPGLWALGDQAAVIPSFSGDGMSIALHSGFRAAESYLAGRGAPEFQAGLHNQLRQSIGLATLVSRLLVGLPTLATALPLLPLAMRSIARRTRIPLDAADTAALQMERA